MNPRCPIEAPSTSEIAPGTVLFGQYEVLGAALGGGMGHVYRCRHLALGEVRAVKVIKPEWNDSRSMEELFVREARALARINHEAIVRCFDLLKEDHRLYLLMEFIDGPSLRELLTHRRLSASETTTLLHRLAAGLEAVHRQGIIHRDVSPDNILLPGGRVSDAKLIDFGVAGGLGLGNQTIGGDFKGKLAYASPEQFGLFGGVAGDRSDVYSLGVVLAEACSGPVFPPQLSIGETIETRRNAVQLPSSIPAELRETLSRMLEPNPTNRPTASAIRDGGLDDQEPREPEPTRSSFAPFSAVLAGLVAGVILILSRSGGAPAMPKPIPVQAPVLQNAVTSAKPTAGEPSSGVRRADMMATAQQFALHGWTMRELNQRAPCTSGYQSDWRPGQQIRGVAYNWGGSDAPQFFDHKLAQGRAAGSHSHQGATNCSAGIDCSGFVAYVWGFRNGHPYSTRTLAQISQPVSLNPYRDLKPGDALNRPGSHVVLFAGYRADGNPNVYEASGSAGRVVLNTTSTWARFAGYRPLRFRNVVD